MMSVRSSYTAQIKSNIAQPVVPRPLQKLALKALPLDPWEKSLAYQQCLANRIIRRYGSVVQAGPFRGMKYIPESSDGCLTPKLLGCYEEELAPAIEDIVADGCDTIVDVGCASGYFLIGLALRQPHAQLFGFDTDAEASARCARNIALNGVGSRVKVGGFCTPSHLNELIKGRTLILSDCEGGEYNLLDPSKAPGLRYCDLIVETHDFINDKISCTLRNRFKDTHSVEIIRSTERALDVGRYPALSALPKLDWFEALTERRPCVMEWMVLRSRVKQAS